MPSPLQSNGGAGLGSRSREPDLSFLNRTPRESQRALQRELESEPLHDTPRATQREAHREARREPTRSRKDLDSLLSANDRRGSLAADDLRKSFDADRAQPTARLNTPPVKQREAPAARPVETDLNDSYGDVAADFATDTDNGATHAAPAPRHRPAASHNAADRRRAARDDKSALFVGSAIRIADGRISSCDSLVVDGHMEADLDGARVLEVTETGTFAGSATVDLATIEGTFEGELTVTGRLVITASGRVSGKIRYARIEIEPGGVILGDLGSLPDR